MQHVFQSPQSRIQAASHAKPLLNMNENLNITCTHTWLQTLLLDEIDIETDTVCASTALQHIAGPHLADKQAGYSA